MRRAALLDSARRIAPLAWPVFVGQVAVLAFNTIDTLMVARAGALDLAALAIGGAVYATVFVGLMGVVAAVGPIAGRHYGAGRLLACGAQLHQAMWIALGCTLLGWVLLLYPDPFLALSHAQPEVAARVRSYLGALAFALPCALLFTAFRGFSTAVSRPRVVMVLQLGALALKIPLTAALVFGSETLRLPAQGALGCGIATAVCMVAQLIAAWLFMRRDPFYARFGIQGRIARPDAQSLRAQLRLGVPMGGSILIEVAGFTFMAFFIARLGATAVSGHQIAMNLVSLMFMLPMAIAQASSALVAQRIGADDRADARRLGWHGVELGTALAAALALTVFALRERVVALYTHDPAIAGAALALLAWLAVFHTADAAQTIAAFVLRAWHVAVVPVVVYALAIWGVGIGGGFALAFGHAGPARLHGAQGFWAAATAGLVVAGCSMCAFLWWMMQRQRAAPAH